MADSKKFGGVHVYWPIACVTGAVHAQPQSAKDGERGVRIEAVTEFSPAPDFVFFDDRGALDAPDGIPYGGVRAIDFEAPHALRIMAGHLYRDGWHS